MTDFLGSRNAIYMFILHGYGDIKPQRFRDFDVELSESRDVIGHVTTGLAECDSYARSIIVTIRLSCTVMEIVKCAACPTTDDLSSHVERQSNLLYQLQ